MKFIVTHEVRVTRDVEIEAPDVKAAFFAACEGDKTGELSGL
jgi:hypothetical protein